MNFFYMTSGGCIHACRKIADIHVASVADAQRYSHILGSYNEKLSDLCLWLAENTKEFSVGICYDLEGCAIKYKYEIVILDDDEAVHFKLIWA
jgi:hypothetical protein